MEKILVVAAKTDDRTRIEDGLAAHGFDVVCASCVISALELTQSEPPDLVVVSDDVPGLGPAELLELHGLVEVVSHVPIIVLSASPKEKFRMFDLGCDDFLLRPVDIDDLVQRIRAVLRRTVKADLSGDLGRINLVDVIQMITGTQRSGELQVETANGRGTLFFEGGHVCDVQFGKEEGETGFFAILRDVQEGGWFCFETVDASRFRKTIDRRTDHLLLAYANTLDEEGGY